MLFRNIILVFVKLQDFFFIVFFLGSIIQTSFHISKIVFILFT